MLPIRESTTNQHPYLTRPTPQTNHHACNQIMIITVIIVIISIVIIIIFQLSRKHNAKLKYNSHLFN